MIEIHHIVKGDGGLAGHSHPSRSAASGIEDARGLAGTVTNEEGFLFLGTDTTGKLTGNIGLQIKGRVVQELIRNLHHGGQLVGRNGHLTEGIVILGERALLVDPRSLALGRDDGNLTVTGVGLDDGSQGAEKVLLLQTLNESAFKLVGHQVAAFGVGTDLQGVAHIIEVLLAHSIPECLTIFIGGTAGLFLAAHSCAGLIGDGAAGGLGQLKVNRSLTLQPVDLFAERHHIGLHLVIGGGILRREQAVAATLGVEECLSSFPRLCALLTQFQNFVHCIFPPITYFKSSSRLSSWSMGVFFSGLGGMSFESRELVTAMRENMMASGLSCSWVSSPWPAGESKRMPSAKPNSTAFVALNQLSASIRCEILARLRLVLIS